MKRKLIVVFLLLFIVCGCTQEKQNERIKFDREAWLHGDSRTRGRMVNNIIKDSILIRKSKIEVLNLLGEQGDTTCNFSYQVDLGLKTGPIGLGGVWPFRLNVHFDTVANKVFEVNCND